MSCTGRLANSRKLLLSLRGCSPTMSIARPRGERRNEHLGLNGVLAELNCGGLLGNEKVMRSLQLICEQVAPYFH